MNLHHIPTLCLMILLVFLIYDTHSAPTTNPPYYYQPIHPVGRKMPQEHDEEAEEAEGEIQYNEHQRSHGLAQTPDWLAEAVAAVRAARDVRAEHEERQRRERERRAEAERERRAQEAQEERERRARAAEAARAARAAEAAEADLRYDQLKRRHRELQATINSQYLTAEKQRDERIQREAERRRRDEELLRCLNEDSDWKPDAKGLAASLESSLRNIQEGTKKEIQRYQTAEQFCREQERLRRQQGRPTPAEDSKAREYVANTAQAMRNVGTTMRPRV